jgi:hypothetical protein
MKSVYVFILLAVVGAASFFGGMKFQESKRGQFQRIGSDGNMMQFRGPNGASGGTFNRQGYQPVGGEIIKKDDTSLTLKLEDGSSKIIILGDSTKINKAEEVKKEDLKEGEKVVVFGTTNSDGSVTAQNVQVNSGQGMMFQRNSP